MYRELAKERKRDPREDIFGSKQAYWEHGSLPRCDCPPSSSASAPQSAVHGPQGGDMKISDPVIDLRTDWHPKIARFLEGNAGPDNPGRSARGPKRATDRKTKTRPASLIRVGIPVFAKRKSPRRLARARRRPCPDARSDLQVLPRAVRARAARRYKLTPIAT